MHKKRTKAKRKLVGKATMAQLKEQVLVIGASLARAMNNLNLDSSRPTIDNLLHLYDNADETILASLFPPWLPENALVMENPDGWVYEGRFPYGKWVELDEDN